MTGNKIRKSILASNTAKINVSKNYESLVERCKQNCESARINNTSGWVSKNYGAWHKGLTKETDNRVKTHFSENRKQEKNPMFGKLHTEETKLMISDLIKDLIFNGQWTPNVHNSNTHWIATYKNKKFRSSLEAAFYCINEQYVIFEKTRIKYELNNKSHNYIIDFTDEFNKILYEIKPLSFYEKDKDNCKIKEQFAIKLAKEHNYEYKIVNEYFLLDNFHIIIDNKENFTVDTFNKILKTYEACKKNRNK